MDSLRLPSKDFRTLFLTSLGNAEIPQAGLKKIAGHSDIRTTMTYYVNLDSRMQIDALKKAREQRRSKEEK